jgi:nitrous oxide reductase accessory protein NosL
MNIRHLVPLAVLATLPSCAPDKPDGPPDLRLGRDECRECGMIISEHRSAAGLLLDRDGRIEPALFDDIGCMLDLEDDETEMRIVGRYVHDYRSGEWLRASEAVFLLSSGTALPTPMGSGIAAFSTRVDAQAAQAGHGGQLLDYPQLRVERRTWRKDRYERAGD